VRWRGAGDLSNTSTYTAFVDGVRTPAERDDSSGQPVFTVVAEYGWHNWTMGVAGPHGQILHAEVDGCAECETLEAGGIEFDGAWTGAFELGRADPRIHNQPGGEGDSPPAEGEQVRRGGGADERAHGGIHGPH
jgi:hypothetical protein